MEIKDLAEKLSSQIEAKIQEGGLSIEDLINCTHMLIDLDTIINDRKVLSVRD